MTPFSGRIEAAPRSAPTLTEGLTHLLDPAERGLAMQATRNADIDRFWSKVVTSPDCWLWTGLVDHRGYGRLRYQRRLTLAHRASYEMNVGPIPDGLTIDHLCCNKLCVRPNHLEPVTRGENVRRWAQTITECPSGHPYDDGNTYRNPTTGKRACLECERLRSRRRDQRPVPCPECGERFTRSNLARHRRRIHGGAQ